MMMPIVPFTIQAKGLSQGGGSSQSHTKSPNRGNTCQRPSSPTGLFAKVSSSVLTWTTSPRPRSTHPAPDAYANTQSAAP